MARISNTPKWMGLYNKYGSNDFHLAFLSAAALVHGKYTSLANECLDEFEDADADKVKQMTEMLLVKQDFRERRSNKSEMCYLDVEYLKRKITEQYGSLQNFSRSLGKTAPYTNAMLNKNKKTIDTALMFSGKLGVPLSNVILGGVEDEE